MSNDTTPYEWAFPPTTAERCGECVATRLADRMRTAAQYRDFVAGVNAAANPRDGALQGRLM
jgi:hypothetical protein